MLKYLVEHFKRLLGVCHSRNVRKKGQGHFFTGTISFFEKFGSFDFLGPKELTL